MTEIEILDRQEQTGNREFYLMLIGRFYHAYGCGAFALARVTGYHVRRIQRKQGEVCVLGFPIDSFDSVRDKVTAPAACGWLENEVRNFDLSIATPVDAMIFVCSLKKRLLADNNEQKR